MAMRHMAVQGMYCILKVQYSEGILLLHDTVQLRYSMLKIQYGEDTVR